MSVKIDLFIIANTSPRRSPVRQFTPPPSQALQYISKLPSKTTEISATILNAMSATGSNTNINNISPVSVPFTSYEKGTKLKKIRQWTSKDVKDWITKLNLTSYV